MAKAQAQAPAQAAQTTVPDGFAKMQAPEGCTGCSYDGEDYPAEEGFVIVPMGAVLSLMSHGFTTGGAE